MLVRPGFMPGFMPVINSDCPRLVQDLQLDMTFSYVFQLHPNNSKLTYSIFHHVQVKQWRKHGTQRSHDTESWSALAWCHDEVVICRTPGLCWGLHANEDQKTNCRMTLGWTLIWTWHQISRWHPDNYIQMTVAYCGFYMCRHLAGVQLQHVHRWSSHHCCQPEGRKAGEVKLPNTHIEQPSRIMLDTVPQCEIQLPVYCLGSQFFKFLICNDWHFCMA